MSKEQNRIAQRLHRLYSKSVQRDVFGRRKATARELEMALQRRYKKIQFQAGEKLYQPTPKDIEDKIRGLHD
jgi:hypothetical protein